MRKTVLDHEKLHRHILKKLSSIKKPQRYINTKNGISRATIWRIQQGKKITMESFLTITDWLDTDRADYFKYERAKREI